MFTYPIYNHNWRNISTIYVYITRLASNKIFSPSNKIHREVVVVLGQLQSVLDFGPVVKPLGITVKKEGGKVVETSG